MDRKEYIGGSDIAAVLGLSRWKTPLQLWSEKSGKVEPDDLSEVEAVQMGTKLEDFVAKEFSDRTGMTVRKAPQIYTHKQFPMFRCQVDRLITGTDELLECKTASAWKAKEWEDGEIPLEYVLQVSWQLYVTGRKVGWIAVLIGGQKFLYKKIEADQELFDKMEAAACRFWEMVKHDIMPSVQADDNSFIVNLYPRGSNVEMLEATADINEALDLLQQTKAEMAELNTVKNELEAKIKAVVGEAYGISTPKYVVLWQNVKGTTYTVTKPDSRRLIIKDRFISNKKGGKG